MTALLYIVGWALIGSMVTGFVLGGADFDSEKDGFIPLMILGTIFWPIVVLLLLLYRPASWAWHFGQKMSERNEPKKPN